jgi:hypothetical protein
MVLKVLLGQVRLLREVRDLPSMLLISVGSDTDRLADAESRPSQRERG